MNDEQYFLANAYVDGELTADERAVAEADPEVMSEVEQLRVLRDELRDVPAPSAAARDTAIATAMAQFAPAAPTPAPAPRVVAFRPRPRYRQYLAFAAAVVAIGLLGVVIVTGFRGGDADDSDATASFDDTAADDADDAGDAATDDAGGDAGDASDDVAGRDMAESDADSSLDSGQAPAADEESAEMLVEDSAGATFVVDDGGDAADMADMADAAADDGDSGDDVVTGAIAIAPSSVPVEPGLVPDPAVIAQIALELLEREGEGAITTPETRCVFPDADDPARILGRSEIPVPSGVVDLFIAVDDVVDVVYGIDPDTCEILVEGPLP